MTQDEIIVWAKEFGLQVKPPSWGYSDTHTIGNIYVEHLEVLVKLVAAKEREACAKVCKQLSEKMTDMAAWGAQECLKAIKARGQA